MAPNSINIVQEAEEWIVVLMEDGMEARRAFRILDHATSWMEGQRIRLGMTDTSHAGGEVGE